MFAALASIQRNKRIMLEHNSIIREAVMDIDHGPTGLDLLMQQDEDNIPESVVDAIDYSVGELIKDHDVSNMTDDEIDQLASKYTDLDLPVKTESTGFIF